MPKRIITEGGARGEVHLAATVSKEMEVFYNPVMKLNRDVSVLLLKTLGEQRRQAEIISLDERGRGVGEAKNDGRVSDGEKRNERERERKKRGKGLDEGSIRGFSVEAWRGWRIGSPLAGSGIRECRFLVELEEGLVESVSANDQAEEAVALIRKNIELNEEKLTCEEIEVSCAEANRFLLESTGFSYIDVDPFGTPNPFLDAAVKRLQRDGILAVTATDTSALSGTYPDACRRKYWAEPMRNHLMHEAGIRILIRKVQLIGAQYEKLLLPIYCFSKDHYLRVFFLCQKHGRKEVANLLTAHRYLHHCPFCLSTTMSDENCAECCVRRTLTAGPLWSGLLWNAELAEAMALMNASWRHGQPENQGLLETIAAEARAPVIGFYPFNLVRQRLGKEPGKKHLLLGKQGIWPTHFFSNAVKVERIALLFDEEEGGKERDGRKRDERAGLKEVEKRG